MKSLHIGTVVKLGFLKKYLDFYKTFNQNLLALTMRSKPKRDSVQFKLLIPFRHYSLSFQWLLKYQSNKTIMPSEGVFQCNVNKLIDLLIFDAIQQVRLCNKRPDSSAIFKEMSKVHATNFTEEDIENRIEGLINEKKTC